MMKSNPENPIGIYVHIPFCRSKCPYCDFYSHCDLNMSDAYVNALKKDISGVFGMSEFVDETVFSRPVKSVYFGGGTPSLLGAKRLSDILNTVKENYKLLPDAEITAECNPSTPDIEKFFEECRKNGFNRISLGMQSAIDSERKILGRTADFQRVKFCVQAARNAGIDNISVDIMLGVPFQSLTSLEKSLDFALSLGVSHISAYILKLEENTYFYKNRQKLSLPDEDTVADMYLFMCQKLENAGMRHYEISNFCFRNKFSCHNMIYWNCEEYLGFGPSAHSYFNGKRFYYDRDFDGYLNGGKAVFDCFGGNADEKFMLMLRTDGGVDLDKWSGEFGIALNQKFNSEVELLKNHGLVLFENGIIKLTDNGMLLSNSVISSLLSKI